ncbi:hypothetical protein Tco_0436710 [Tanacetum coccineum]
MGHTISVLAVGLCLRFKDKKGDKVVKKELPIILKGEVYLVKFIINPVRDDIVPGIVLGRSFLKITRGVVDFGKGIMTIYPDYDSFHDDTDNSDNSEDDWDAILLSDEGPSLNITKPLNLNGVHDTFHVSNLKKCLANPTLKVPLDEIRVDAKLNFMEEPVEILERKFKKLKRSRIAIVKVRWNSKRGPEFTWELED